MSAEIGERIRALRRERGLSQEDVARRTGIGLKSYGDIERGRVQDPHYSTLAGIARALDTTVAELVEEDPAFLKAEAGQEPAAWLEERVGHGYLFRYDQDELEERVEGPNGDAVMRSLRYEYNAGAEHPDSETRAEVANRYVKALLAYLAAKNAADEPVPAGVLSE